jgi:Fe-S cluster assembly iron-binding protein IscA
MLRITDHAVSFLDEARSVQRIPEHYGIRVFGAARLNGQTAVDIRFSERPLTGDEVNETQGTRLFVAPEISSAVGDLVLDVDQRESGPQLVLRAT